ERELGRRRQALRLVEHASDLRRHTPDAEAVELRQLLTRAGNAFRHVGTRVHVDRELDRQLDGVELAQERSDLEGYAEPRHVVEAGVAGLLSREELAAEEGPRVVAVGAADEDGIRDRKRQPRGEERQDGELELEARDADRPLREAEGPVLVHEPDRVVPALGEAAQRAHLQLGELAEQTAHLLVDDDVGGPDGHRRPSAYDATLTCTRWTALLQKPSKFHSGLAGWTFPAASVARQQSSCSPGSVSQR